MIPQHPVSPYIDVCKQAAELGGDDAASSNPGLISESSPSNTSSFSSLAFTIITIPNILSLDQP